MTTRTLKRRSCDGKKRYPDKTAAVGVVLSYYERKLQVFGLRTYKCQFCRKWHIGHRDHRNDRL